MTERHMSWSSWAQLLVLSVLWGATFVLAGLALRELPPGQPTSVGVLRRGHALTVALTPVER